MSQLRSYLNHLTSKDYKITPSSHQQQTIRTYIDDTSYGSYRPQVQDSMLSQGFSFSGSDKQKDSQYNYQSHKYVNFDPKSFVSKAIISVQRMKQLINQSLQILSMIQSDKSQRNKQFVDNLLIFLEWVQDRISFQKSKQTQRKICKQQKNDKQFKRRQFYDKTGKVVIEMRKITNKQSNRRL